MEVRKTKIVLELIKFKINLVVWRIKLLDKFGSLNKESLEKGGTFEIIENNADLENKESLDKINNIEGKNEFYFLKNY